jgi:hypothetical protein
MNPLKRGDMMSDREPREGLGEMIMRSLVHAAFIEGVKWGAGKLKKAFDKPAPGGQAQNNSHGHNPYENVPPQYPPPYGNDGMPYNPYAQSPWNPYAQYGGGSEEDTGPIQLPPEGRQ